MNQDGSRDALVVGINTYKYSRLKSLKTPSENAEAIAQRLTEYGSFRIKRIPEAVQEDNSLRVGRQKEVTLKQLRIAIEQLFMPQGGTIPDTALLFFSGHGLRDDSRIKKGYLATSDVNPDDEKWGLSLPWLRELLEESPIKQQIVWLDCCYSGELLNFDKNLKEADLDCCYSGELLNFDKNLKEADPGNQENRDRCLITASRGFEVAYEEVSGIHGVLTGALLKGLDPRERPDGYVTTHTLADFINKELKTETQRPLCHNSGRAISLTNNKPKSVNSPDEGICPYKGLEYFKQEDAHFFWGRTALTDELIEQVRTENFIAILGASGSGKSSVLRAGLLHQLNLGVKLTGSNRWQIYQPFTPGEHPLQNLEVVIGRAANELNQLVTEAETSRLVLVVDQFEECFTMCQDSREREQFFDCLLSAVEREDNKLCLVLGMRADFLGKCAEYAGLANKIDKHLVTVKPMTPKELKEAIVKPAEQVGLEVEPQLVTRMIDDVADSPGSLPLLQYTLMELWKAWRKSEMNWLNLFFYEQLGGDKGGIKGILEKRANEVYESLNEEEKPVAQRIFIELTQLGEVADTRRRVRKEDLINSQHSEALLDGVIRKLAEARLITTTEAGLITTPEKSKSQDSQSTQIDALKPNKLKPNAVIDITHEALIRHWEKLRDWVKEYRIPLEIERRIEAEAKEWAAKGKAEGLLLREGRLVEAEDYQRDYLNLGFLDGIAQEFIEESINLRDRLLKEEEERRQREQEQKERAVEGQIGALSSLSETRILTNDPLGALFAAVKAGIQLKQAPQLTQKLGVQVEQALQQVVYGIQEQNRLEGNTDPIYDVCFSPDGKTIATANWDKTIKIWGIDGTLLKTLEGHTDQVNTVAYCRNSNLLASGSSDKTVKLWRTHDGALIKSFQGHDAAVFSVAFHPDGEILASASEDGTVKLWNVYSESLINTIQSHSGATKAVFFSPDGKLLASSGWDLPRWTDRTKLWRIDGTLHRTIDVSSEGKGFSPNGETLAIGSGNGHVKVIQVADGQTLLDIEGHNEWVMDVSFSPDGKTLASVGIDKTVKLWTVDGKLITVLYGHTDAIYSAAFSPDGKTLATASADRTVRLWNVNIPFLMMLSGERGSAHMCISFSPVDGTLVSGSWDLTEKGWTVKLWDTSSQKLLRTLPKHHDTIRTLNFSRDGELFASASWDGAVKVWTKEGELVTSFTEHGTPVSGMTPHVDADRASVNGVSFSADGNFLASVGYDRHIRFWGLDGTQLKVIPNAHADQIYKIDFSADGKFFATASWDRTVRLWSLEGELLKTFTGHSGWLYGFSFSPDSNLIASAGLDRQVRIWNINGELLQTLVGHRDGIYDLSFSPDSKMIASASLDQTVKLWSIDGALLRTITGHTGGIYGVSFSPDGQTVTSASWDGSIKLWNATTLNFDSLLKCGCSWLHDYLKTNPNAEEDRHLCDDICTFP